MRRCKDCDLQLNVRAEVLNQVYCKKCVVKYRKPRGPRTPSVRPRWPLHPVWVKAMRKACVARLSS
jgi:hypothetical protein